MKDAKGHGSEKRGGGQFDETYGLKGGTPIGAPARPGAKFAAPAMPIPDHPYHTKTNDELNFIAKDASAAAKNMQGMGNAQAEGKYLDQVNDASTVLGYRQRGGADLSQGPAAGVAAQHGISGPAVREDPGAGFVRTLRGVTPPPEIGRSPFPSNADFMAKYGGPRDHAAEQRGFNSGMREINRLKRQGK